MEEEQCTNEPLLSRMKKYESQFTSSKIDNSLPFVMRLDGVGFSRFTRGLNKPYDYNLCKAFTDTTIDLMKEYRADLGYTHSDEISLVFYPKRTKKDDGWRESMYGGKIQKIVSTSAAFCTMTFNKHLTDIFKDKKVEYAEKSYAHDKMMSSKAYFDSRIFQIPDDTQMFSYLFSRSQVDCKRNHVFGLARRYYTKGELFKTSTKKRIDMLEEKGVTWAKEPACFRRGSFFKRKKIMLDENNMRYEFIEVDVELEKFDDDINNFLKSEYIN
jgi:tRNA(His) 5'-end guanylyltransferase